MKFSLIIYIFAWIFQCLFLWKQISSSLTVTFLCTGLMFLVWALWYIFSWYRMAIKVYFNCKSIISSLIGSTSLYASTHLGLKLVVKELYMLVPLHLHGWYFRCIICYVMVSSLAQNSHNGSVSFLLQRVCLRSRWSKIDSCISHSFLITMSGKTLVNFCTDFSSPHFQFFLWLLQFFTQIFIMLVYAWFLENMLWLG
jgi:hypothetical protein